MELSSLSLQWSDVKVCWPSRSWHRIDVNWDYRSATAQHERSGQPATRVGEPAHVNVSPSLRTVLDRMAGSKIEDSLVHEPNLVLGVLCVLPVRGLVSQVQPCRNAFLIELVVFPCLCQISVQ